MSSVQGVDDLLRRLHAMEGQRGILRTIQIAGVQEAQKRVHRQTGFLQRNIRPGRLTNDTATIEARTPYAAAEELGRRAVTIRPRNAKVLAWGGPRRLSGRMRTGGKATHFARVVHQPARKGHPYLVPGVREALKRVQGALVDLWNRAA